MAEQEKHYKALERSLSAARLARYRSGEADERIVYAKYFWNMDLSAAIYVAVNMLEVALRNELNERISLFYNTDRSFSRRGGAWFEDEQLVHHAELVKVNEAKESLALSGHDYPSPDQVIASMSFGFWLGLFAKRYECNSPNYKGLWPHIWRNGRFLLNCRSQDRSRERLCTLLTPLRELRNRVAHHEPIYNRPNLLKEYQDIKLLLGWIDPVLPAQLDVICDFEQVYTRGVAGSRWALANPA